VVEIFVAHLKGKAEAFAGAEISTVVHGRPVRFDDDDKADARAESVLKAIAKEAGFRDIAFVYEPIAAAHHYEQTIEREELALIADIGGGTSDFSVIRVGPQHRGRADRAKDVLANAGLRVGGTDFDTALNLAGVMPLLGLGTELVERNKKLPMPAALYHELAAWPTINFAYTYKNEREIAGLAGLAREPWKVERLLAVVRQKLGHALAFAVEEAKIELSAAERADVPHSFIEPGLAITASRGDFDHAIEARVERLYRSASDCIAAAGLKPDSIDTVFLTGGSSRVPAVRAAIGRAAPSARQTGGSDLLSVALGLTQMAGGMR
jgi:hypothetical chaperone protein